MFSAGQISCQYIIDKLKGKGNLLIENGPHVSSVIDRVTGCNAALAKAPGIKVLSSDQDGKGSRDGGMSVMQSLLTRFPKVDAIFAINDPQAIGSNLAAKQQNRSGIIITSVDGAPDIESALKDSSASMIEASASQDPFAMARKAVAIGVDILNDKKPRSPGHAAAVQARDAGQHQRLQGLDIGPLGRVTHRKPRAKGGVFTIRRVARAPAGHQPPSACCNWDLFILERPGRSRRFASA